MNTINSQNTKHIGKDAGKEIWDSRSVAVCVMVVFAGGGLEEDKFLIVKRSNKISDGGLHCLPCGYLDRDETVSQAASRELFEETGISIDSESLKLYDIDDEPKGNLQNITFHYAYLFLGGSKALEEMESKIKIQEDECSDVFFVSEEEVKDLDFAFGHKNRILENFQ